MSEKRRIAVISPVLPTDAVDVMATLAPFRNDVFDVEHFFLDEGPASIENEADVAACLPGLLAASSRILELGWGALVINCMCDPGLPQLRSKYALPVFGPAETSMHLAARMGRRFSTLDVVSDGREFVQDQVARYGLQRQFVSHRAIDIPVLELSRDPARTVSALEAQALLALEDGADLLILGCTGLAELADRLGAALVSRGTSAAVMEPLRTTLAVVQASLVLDLGDSLRSGRS